ncbi:hypothetical protein CF392_12915 [Tamilnaduibacter salinus]|uniref:Solute-binding protein family 3/N-terminal domain-containing protein n=1 Tax=Tamilnaduibacter salinus TaxID=1484056 RepID=A0A2A2I1Q7_9GAMM|nr:transporter substrate-binding domain-containing protein [Tamilnaduibacter salinus]PAV25065.1 hypothetical protein CF392_12915 [Tamilnaduibacter salinus]
MNWPTPRDTAISVLVLFSFTLSASADTVSIRADSWYPMNGDPRSDKPGYMIELAETIFGQHGYEVDYQNLPWERSLQSVRRGNHDCVVGAYEADAPDFIFPDTPWGYDQSAFYVDNDSTWQYEGLESLSSVTMAIIGGYAYGEAFDAYVQSHPEQVQSLNANNALEQNIRKVAGGRVDVLIESPAVLEAQLQDMGMSGQLKQAGTLGDPVPMYIACSPANAERSNQLVELVSQGTRALRESGELERIMNRYGLDTW